MLKLPTVLLYHVTVEGSHYDWLIEDPTARLSDTEANSGPEARALWAGRVSCDSRQWATRKAWDVEQIAPHRRHYLTYEGPISGGRGSVTRVDEGAIVSRLWTPDRIAFDLTMRHCAGPIELVRVSPTHWRAQLLAV